MNDTPVLQMEAVRKAFSSGFLGRKKAVLNNLSLDVRKGEVFGLLGHNGAGKTTTMRIALGILHADAGRVHLFGKPGVTREAKFKIGFLPDNIGLYPSFTAVDMLRFNGELFRMGRADIRRTSTELLEMVGLASDAKVRIGKYSKGMRQRLGIALSVMNDPELLVLDEPYSGLDPIGRRDVRKLLLSLKERGKTIIVSSHIVPDMEAVCDRVGVLTHGRIERCIELREIYRQKSAEVEITVTGVNGRDLIGREANIKVVYSTNEAVVVRCDGVEATNAVIHKAIAAGGRIVELKPLRFNLEDYIFETWGDTTWQKTDEESREYAHR
jgi:ABC-2 type transport system ATP-binding protein